jgi:XRE family transcriptional regulator, fatty acid utilization regulator
LKEDKIIYIGPALKRVRKQMGITQARVAATGKINRGYVSDLERDENKPTIDMIFQVAYGLGIEPYELVRQIQNDNPDFPSKIKKMEEKE